VITAEIIAIGSELLTPFRTDTNSLYLTRTLEERGIRVIAKSIVGDDHEHLVDAFRIAFARADVILCSGGLGPTVDDLTREALVAFLEIPLRLNPEILEWIEARFAKRGMKMPEINRKQAMVPEGATVLPNHNGTAPGLFLEARGKQIFLLPGPPFELEPMWERSSLRLLRSEQPFQRKIFRIAMLPESQVDEMLQSVSSSLKEVQYTILASPSEIEVHLLAPDSAATELVSACAEVRAIMGNKIYAEDLITLEQVVGRLMKEAQKKVAVAESCTGGLLAQRFTEISGSSTYFERGVVVYSNRAKTELLGVPGELIEANGAVSEPVARAMAEGIRTRTGVDYGISITGVAGPEGGSAEKPVGTVFVGLADSKETAVKQYSFPGNRSRVRFSSSQAALNLLRLKLLE